MTITTRRRIATGAGILAASVLTVVGTATTAGASNHQILHGEFQETAAGADRGFDIAGSAKLVVGDDWTTAKVNVAGLNPGTQYGSHLHNAPCSTGGGGHYQDDDSGSGLTTPPNELWLSSTSDPQGKLIPNRGGSAHGHGSADWAARLTSTTQTNARSIVVHDTDGTRIACADLV